MAGSDAPPEYDLKTGIPTSIAAGGAREMEFSWYDGAGADSLVRTGGALNWTNSSGVETDAFVEWGNSVIWGGSGGGNMIGAIPHTTLKWAMTSNAGGFDWLFEVLDGSQDNGSLEGYAADGVLEVSIDMDDLAIDWNDVDTMLLYMLGSEGLSMSADSFTAVGSIGVIPEPGTLTMALIGCACVGFVRRRRQPLSV